MAYPSGLPAGLPAKAYETNNDLAAEAAPSSLKTDPRLAAAIGLSSLQSEDESAGSTEPPTDSTSDQTPPMPLSSMLPVIPPPVVTPTIKSSLYNPQPHAHVPNTLKCAAGPGVWDNSIYPMPPTRAIHPTYTGPPLAPPQPPGGLPSLNRAAATAPLAGFPAHGYPHYAHPYGVLQLPPHQQRPPYGAVIPGFWPPGVIPVMPQPMGVLGRMPQPAAQPYYPTHGAPHPGMIAMPFVPVACMHAMPPMATRIPLPGYPAMIGTTPGAGAVSLPMAPGAGIMSHETVRRITQNDPGLVTLVIARESDTAIEELASLGYELLEERDGLFDPNNRAELGKLGESIASNTVLGGVIIHGQHFPNNAPPATHSHRSLLSGFKRNASIRKLALFSIDLSQGLGNELLTSFKDGNHPLRRLSLINCDLGGGGVAGSFNMASTLSAFKHVKKLHLTECNVDDQCLQTISAAISGYELKVLHLRNNNIGRAGCGTLATLLKDQNSNLRHINLDQNNIEDSCCTALADALKKNKKLQTLHLNQNPQITETGMNAFTEVLCDTTSINATYLSNHTLMKMTCHGRTMSNHLTGLLIVNSDTDKRFIAMHKVLKYHRNPNMATLFEWDLKVLPYLVDLFDDFVDSFDEFRKRWRDNHSDIRDDSLERATARQRTFLKELNKRKLSVMYQFVRAMPLMCVPNRSHRGVKRKHAHAV